MWMGQACQGTFAVPVHVPLPVPVPVPVPEDGERRQCALHDGSSSRAAGFEPFERRVTRTLAQAVAAVRDLVADGEEPAAGELRGAVERGVSAELCAALGRILSGGCRRPAVRLPLGPGGAVVRRYPAGGVPRGGQP
jgi:hypothetical protein